MEPGQEQEQDWRTTPPPKHHHWSAKLTEAQVADILLAYKSGWNINALARKHGVGWVTVREIVAGKTWQHVPRPEGFKPWTRKRRKKSTPSQAA